MQEQKSIVLVPRLADDSAPEAAQQNKSSLKTLHYWGDVETLSDNEGCMVDDACIAALKTLATSGEGNAVSQQLGGNPLACNPDEHADAKIIRAWLTSTNHTPDDLRVIFWLAYIVRNEWANFPKRTLTKHNDLFQRIAMLCSNLREAMDATEMPFAHGEGYGLKTLGTTDLLTGSEVDCIVTACDYARGIRDRAHTFSKAERHLFELLLQVPVAAGLPTMQTLLDRVENEARRLQAEGPLHTQPNKRGAERGYFIRRMGELFQRRYGEQPHEAIAALTTIALGEATDRELVAKLLTPRKL